MMNKAEFFHSFAYLFCVLLMLLTCYYTQNLHFQEILSQLLENAVVFIVILKQSQAIAVGRRMFWTSST